MKALELYKALEESFSRDPKSKDESIVIPLQRNGFGGTPFVSIKGIHSGFDWNSGKMFVQTEKTLYDQNPKELLDAIHNLMSLIDSPIGRRKVNSEFADEVRKEARGILKKNGISLDNL